MMENEIIKSSLLPLVKNINLMELLPIILNVKKENFKVTPSEFLKEMSLTTEERYKNLVHTASVQKIIYNNYPPQFKLIPHIIVFQKFEPRKTYFLVLEVKNIGKTLLPLKIVCPSSIYFTAQCIGAPVNKLAPGLSVEYEITFTPKETKDYAHHLVLKSKEETFCIPIIAIGPRPILDIPDQIHLNSTPVKLPSSKFIVVRNIGNTAAVFNFITESNQFQVNPAKGFLDIHESMVLNISFESSKVGKISEPLYLILETGEKLTILLHGWAENIGIRLDKNSVTHEDTYVGLKHCKTLRIDNNSASVVKFTWKKNKSQEDDLNIIECMKEKYKELNDLEILKDTKIRYFGLSSSSAHKLSCERILKDQLHLLEEEELVFCHDAFSIVPQAGEVWPKNFAEVIVAFEPKICGLVETEAYLEISGRDSRLPVRIKGKGLGPKILLNVKSLDIDYIYLCSFHRYEVIAANKGDIPGNLEYKAETLVFGGKIEVTPESRYLNPGECGSFVLSFTSNRQGDFTEKLVFVIKESQECVSLIFKGKIISPTLHFDIRQIDFGVVSVGFPTVREVTLNNLSMVPVTFSLRILSDGDTPSLSYEQFAKFTIKPPLALFPKEFQIDPKESVVEPFSNKKVTLTLTANRSGHFLSYLVVDMWDSESGSVSCPILFHPHVPTITADPELINIPFCFINFPYTRSIILRNVSKIAGYFYIVPTDPNADTSITISANIPQGIIESRSSTKIDITVMTSSLGQQTVPVNLIVFGYNTPREISTISCVGQGPVVTINPNSLSWEELPLLEEGVKELVVSNESPIPASLSIFMGKPNSPWSVSPSNFTLAPDESVSVYVSLTLIDRGKFRETLRINVHNGKVLTVPLTATGVGSSLKITPNIHPSYNLGTLFSNKKYDFDIKIENKGTKAYGLVWSPFSEYKTFLNAKLINPSDLIFKMEPPKLDLAPGEVKIVTLEVQSISVGYSNQVFYCFANIGVPTKELHMTCDIFAEFVEPLIIFDKSEINYWYNFGFSESEQKLEDTVQVTNNSVLPVDVHVSAEYPFCVEKDSKGISHSFEISIPGLETQNLTVKFIAQPNEKKYSRIFKENLIISFKEHTKKVILALKGEVNYPNIMILPTYIDFDYVPLGTCNFKEIFVVNVSPFKIYFKIAWNLPKCSLVYPEKADAFSFESTFLDEKDVTANTTKSELIENLNNENNQLEEETVREDTTGNFQNLVRPKEPTATMPEIKISKTDIKEALFNLAVNHNSHEEEMMELYNLASSSEVERSKFSEICDITPFCGALEQFSSQILSLRFSPNKAVNAHLEASISVVSGPTENLTIEGKSGEINFQLSETEFDFGKMLFKETKSRNLIIYNLGPVPISYEADTKNDRMYCVNEDCSLGKGTITLVPKTGNIDSFSNSELSICYHPGVPGQFEEKFQLQISHLDPMMLIVKGFGVFPQVHVSLPRPDLLNIPNELGYEAIASITPDWFLTGFSNFSGMNDMFTVKPYRSQESNLEFITENTDANERQEGWEYLKDFDILPSEIDIQLATERVLASNLTKNLLKKTDLAVYARTIPEFYVPAYEVDFGVVVIGQFTEQNVTITNYGPLPVVLYGIFDSHLKADGINIRLKNRNELKIGAYLSFVVSFNPKKSRYRKRLNMIYHGPRIPIKLRSIVTYPYVTSSMHSINFSQVVCGFCKTINLRLYNPSPVTAIWSLALTPRTRDSSSFSNSQAQNTKLIMYHVNYTSGVLNPNEYCSLQISFKPDFEGFFSANLLVQVIDGLENLKIVLTGEGTEPKLKVYDSVLNFGPTLPYSEKLDKTFRVENPCSFPIEVFCPTFDDQIFEEEKILRSLFTYYSTKELLLPVRKPGDSLPIEIVNFYYMLLNNLNEIFVDQERLEALEENTSCILSSEDDFIISLNFSDHKKKHLKKLKSFSRSKTTIESNRALSIGNETSKEFDIYSTPLFQRKTDLEIEEMLTDYIKQLHITGPIYDPIQTAFQNILSPAQVEEYREGTLILFHGAPFSDSIHLANKAGLNVGLLVLSIDRIVLEEATLGRCEAGLTARELIEQTYWDHVEPKPDDLSEFSWIDNEELITDNSQFDKDFEEIERKFEALLELRQNLIQKGKGARSSTAKSEASKKLEKGGTPNLKPMNLNAPFAGISEDLILEILKFRIFLEVNQGLIIEGFHNSFINSSIKALTLLLKAAGNIKNILVIFLMNNYANYNRSLTNMQTEKAAVIKFQSKNNNHWVFSLLVWFIPEDDNSFGVDETLVIVYDITRCKNSVFQAEVMKILEEEPEEIFECLQLEEPYAMEMHSIFISQRRILFNTFEKMKEKFYEREKLKRLALKKGLPVTSLTAKFDVTEKTEKDSKDKGKKKETEKVSKTADFSGKKTGSDIKSARNKRDSVEGEFIAFEFEFMEMKVIIENWDQRIGRIVNENIAEPKVKKTQTPKATEPQNLKKIDRGIFLWVADVSNCNSKVLEAVCCHLKTVLRDQIPFTESAVWPIESAPSLLRSVVTYPSVRNKIPALDFYTMSEIEASLHPEDSLDDLVFNTSTSLTKLVRSVSQISFKSKKQSRSFVKRRKADSGLSFEMKNSRSIKESNTGLSEGKNIKYRWILQPGETMHFSVKYLPTEVGKSEQTYPLNIVNWHNGDFVYCKGICDIPTLDMTPEVMYPSVRNERPITSAYSPTYFYSDDTYDFGSIVTVHTNEEKKKGSKKTAVLNLVNNCSLPIELGVFFSQDVTSDELIGSPHIRFQPEKLLLKPGNSQPLTVTANPAKIGFVTETLMLFIKDNPKIERIHLKCEGIKANVSVDPKTVNFDRLLLHRKDFRRIAFTNNNFIPFYITLTGLENLPRQFSFSKTSGWIAALEAFMIEIYYDATEVQTIVDQMVSVLVFDDISAEEPVQEISFFVSVEAYDVALDIIFSNKDDDHIDFGDIRAENNYTNVFNLKNSGKYPLGFKIDTDNDFLSNFENDQLFISPQEGKLPPGKLFPITVSFMAQTEVIWKRLPLIKISLVEPFNADELIAIIPIEVSVRSFFSRYEIEPLNEFSFGHIKVCSAVNTSLLILNKGRFSLTYLIEHVVKTDTLKEIDNSNKKSSKPSVSSKEKGKKIMPSILTAGVFEISPSFGSVEAGKNAVINVTCLASEVKSYEEYILIFVNESSPHLKKGSELRITAEGCLPYLNLNDIKNIFREHLIVKNNTDLRCLPKCGSYTYFTEDICLLSFKNICVNKKYEARIHLRNDGLIPCHVNVNISNVEPEKGSASSLNEGSHIFDVKPSHLIVEPYNSEELLLTFQPEALEVYKAKLIIRLEMPDLYDDIDKVVELLGNGVLPQVEILAPTSKLPEGQVLVNFPPTCPGQSSTCTIAFSNVGLLDTKVILEFYKYQKGVFAMTPKLNTEKMLKTWELSQPIEHTVIVSLATKQVAEFDIIFTPQEVKNYACEIKLFVVDNPFENLCYKLRGDVTCEEVVFENIQTSLPFLKEKKDCGTINRNTSGHYVLNFGECYVKKKSKALLRLVNKTERDYFKFEWEETSSMMISPLIGHLYPNSYKEILIVFYPEEPTEIEESFLVCSLNKILFACPPEPAWDSRLIRCQKQSKLDFCNDIKESCQEPEHEVIPETNKILTVSTSGIADYAKLICETSQVIFKNTFMFQTRKYSLVLENPGNITLEYKLTLKSVTAAPLKEDKKSQAKENSFLSNSNPRRRPQSSYPLASVGGSKSDKSNTKFKCTRPMTCVSLLELNKPLPEVEFVKKSNFGEPEMFTYNPFSIENLSGRIPPKEKRSCDIKFSPMDINEYKAIIGINVNNLHPEYNLADIEITASSLMPYCHFNIPESDYLESGRRDYTRPGPLGYPPGLPLDPEMKTIEIKVLGIGQTTLIEFHAINPTEEDYTFSWSNVTQSQPNVVPSFHCTTMDGRIQAGRQQLMVFSFVSQKIGIVESFWKFQIPKFNLETPFLFVGEVRQPEVYCLPNYLNLKPTIIDSTSSDEFNIVNNEEIPIDFYFLPDSFYSEGRLNSIKVEPSMGTVSAFSEIKVRVMFTGKTGGKTLFHLKCKIKCINEAFIVTIEATTFKIKPLVVFEDTKKIKYYADPHTENIIDFGKELNPNCSETIVMTFTSLSKSSFYYEWEFDKKYLQTRFCKLQFSQNCGQVTSFSRKQCTLSLVFFRKSSLNNFPVKLKVKRGPSYTFLINASASIPSCEFSFNDYDFGFCYLQEKDICFNEVLLFIKNKNLVDLTLECCFIENNEDTFPFSYNLPDSVLPPEKEMPVLIGFHPKECILYANTLKFTINGVNEKLIPLRGHGTEFKVALANADDTTISLGAVKVGKISQRKFSLVNKGLAPATVLVGFSDQLPISGVYLTHVKENVIDLAKNHRLSTIITIFPSTPFTIKPQQEYEICVTYTPSRATSLFTETISLQFQERAEPLCILNGCCLGPDISLDRYVLNFGAVVETCTHALKLKIINTGSIGAKFEWDTKDLNQEYFISPVTGYCSPESNVTIQVTFRPLQVRNCIKKNVECKFYLSDNEMYPSQFLSLIGDCVTLPQPLKVVSFKCLVRETVTETLEIENGTGNEWHLVPIISGEYFKGYETLVIPPLSSSCFDVIYCPLTMTSKENIHEGSAFFRFPNGQGVLYQLQGTALPPGPEDIIIREVPCKTKYTELLKIQNWLQYPQRFKVDISCVSNENSEDLVWFCTGLENFDISAQAQKEYSLNFFAYKPGLLKFHVFFVNEESKEYVWFEIVFDIVMCGPLEIITLKSAVRQTSSYEIKLENPLNKPIQYKLETTTNEIHFEKQLYEVQPKQQIYINILFTPIHAREQIEKVTASCPELGTFPRELKLISIEAPPDPPRTFETSLGSSQSQEFTVTNLSHLNSVLQCRTDSEDFLVIQQTNVAAYQSVNIIVTYEPSDLGSKSANLFVSSEESGNFVFPLLGICIKPEAKGPFTLKPGAGFNINFKNPFNKTKDFYVCVDNPAFTVKTSPGSISPKEEFKIHVFLQKLKHIEKLKEYKDNPIEPRFPIAGQVVVECYNPDVKWRYYLKGVLE